MPPNTLAKAVLAIALVSPVAAFGAERTALNTFKLAAQAAPVLGSGVTLVPETVNAMPRQPAPRGLLGNLAGGVESIEGPSWNYQSVQRGLKVEIAALGGGMESAPFLAHIGLDWRF